MKWRSTLLVVTCLLLVASLANSTTLAPTPEVSSVQVSTAQLPFCAAGLTGPELPTWNTTRADLLICGPCSAIVCRGAAAGEFCGRNKHCDQIDVCSDNSYSCDCLANNF